MICPACSTKLQNEALACHCCGYSFQPTRRPVGYGGFWRRVAAVFIDLFLMAPVFFLVKDYLILPASPEEQHAFYELASDRLTTAEYQQVQLAFLQFIAALSMVLFAILAPYYIVMESSALQGTLGKRALGLRVTDMNGRRIRLGRAIVRYLVRPLSSQPFQVGFILAGITPKKQALHDFIARTLVVMPGRAEEAGELPPMLPVDSTRSKAAQSLVAMCPSCGRELPNDGAACEYCVASAPGYRAPRRYAGFWRRALALLIDLVLLAPAVLVVKSYLDTPPSPLDRRVWMSLVSNRFTYREREQMEQALTRRIINAPILYFFLCGLYFVAAESLPLKGSFGKRILRLRVTDLNGRRIGPGRAVKRHLARGLSGAVWGVGFIMAGFTARKQALHDILAGTLVVRAETANNAGRHPV